METGMESFCKPITHARQRAFENKIASDGNLYHDHFEQFDNTPPGGERKIVTLPDGTVQTRQISLLNQGDATYSMSLDDTHLYFPAGTPPLAGTIPSALFARVALPVVDCLPDVNGDGNLTPGDFNAWILAFNNQDPGCDQNGDAQCTPGDFNAWILNFNNGC